MERLRATVNMGITHLGFVFVSTGFRLMEDIDQVLEPHGHVHEIFPHHAQHCRMRLSYLQPPAL